MEKPEKPAFAFRSFEFRTILFTEDQVRRLFNGNGLNQMGLLTFLEKGVFVKDILQLFADFLDLQKNLGFEVFKKVFAKTLPDKLARCKLADYLEEVGTRKNIVVILDVYF